MASTNRTDRKPVEKYGCTCEADSCAACDQGWHRSCRHGCQHGQPVER